MRSVPGASSRRAWPWNQPSKDAKATGSVGPVAITPARVLAVLLLAATLVLAAATAQAAGPPEIGPAWSTEVSATSARLHAEINPNGATTTYHFDYLAEAAYQANLQAGREGFSAAAKAPPGADPALGSGQAFQSVQQSIGALAPETAYRYRVLAGPETGSVHAFTTESLGGGVLLLDNRGWEMVSPVDKNGGDIQGFGGNFGGDVLQAAANGEAATFSSNTSFGAGAQGAPPASQYIARRSSGGWSTENITPPLPAGGYGDHPNGVPYQLFSGDLARGLLLNPRRCTEGEECPRSYSLHDSAGGALTPSPAAPGLRFAGSSPDLRHVVLSTCAKLTPEATEVPGGGGECDPAETNLYEWSEGTLSLTNEPASHHAQLAARSGAISFDGRRVYFTAGEDSPIFLREEGLPTKFIESTVGGGGSFQTASTDGSLAFFTKGAHLYRYNATTEAATDLTPGGEVEGVLGASEDGSRVYYLTAAGLFLWTAPGTATEIAPGPPAAFAGDYPPTTGTARLSADGSKLLFLSKASLTGYDNTDQKTGEPDTEAYLYSAAPGGGGGTLICASCNPTGERPLGPSTIPGAIANGAQPGATQAYKPRDLSADGRRLFFDSSDALVLQDTNNAPDAYEWEAAGVGTCTRPGGCIALISSGRDAEPSSFIDASADGSDAFFLTAASLVPSDPGSADLYDARQAGGFPIPPSPIPCNGDACQSLPPEPEDPAPGTLQPGPGNPPLHFHRAVPRKPHRHRRKGHQKTHRHAAHGSGGNR